MEQQAAHSDPQAFLYGSDRVVLYGLTVSFWDVVLEMDPQILRALKTYLHLRTYQRFLDAYVTTHESLKGAPWLPWL